MSSLLHDTKRQDYNAQRGVSLGAGITLAFRIGHLTAMFNCANHVAEILGDRDLQDLGDGVFESIPIYDIPLADAHKALAKLSAKMSVAIVDFVCEEVGRFVLVWKIPANNFNGAVESRHSVASQQPQNEAPTIHKPISTDSDASQHWGEVSESSASPVEYSEPEEITLDNL